MVSAKGCCVAKAIDTGGKWSPQIFLNVVGSATHTAAVGNNRLAFITDDKFDQNPKIHRCTLNRW